MSTRSIQCHSMTVFVPPIKPPDTVMDIHYGQTYGLKTRVDIWTGWMWNMHHFFIRLTWFFQFVTGITFWWDYLMWHIVALLVWIDLWIELGVYTVNLDQVKWYYRNFGYLELSLIMMCIIIYKNGLIISHRKKCYTP